MAHTDQRIRKVQTSKVGDFDDQLWPINCAILILSGIVVGVVYACSDFGDPRILYNGWARLVSVGLMMGLLFWGVMWLQGKMLRRLQLCILVSLMFHLALAMYLHDHYLEVVAKEEAESAQRVTEPYEQVVEPDYHWEQIEEPEKQQAFEKPVESEAPKPAEPEAIKREANSPEMPTEVEPPDEPEIPQRQQPNPAVTRRAELSAPRRADAAAGAQISRQQWKHRPRPNEPIPEPEIKSEPRKTAALPSAKIAPQQRQETQVSVDQRQTFEEFSSARTEPVEVRMARRASGHEQIADIPTTEAPSRQVYRPTEIPRTEAAVPEPVETAERSPAVEQPQSITRMTARQQADAPTMVSQMAEPVDTPTAPQATNPPDQPATSVTASSPTRRMQQAALPSSQSRAARLPSVARSRAAAQVATTQIEPAADATRLAASTQPSLPTVRQMSGSVSTSAESPTRLAQLQPAGRALPALTRADMLPSAIAPRRATASQQDPAGSDQTPAKPSSLARSRTGVNLPSTAIPADSQAVSTPAAAGGTPASRLEVASSAAVRRAASQPAAGKSVAAAGSAELAIGSSQIVSRIGQPRAAGIGQSSVSPNASTPRIARSAKPVAPSIAASGVPETMVAAPGAVASSASESSIPSFNIRASAAKRGGTVRPLAAQATFGSGPPDSSGTPGPIGVAQSSRVTRYESVGSAMAGGGTPKPGRTVGGAVAPNATAETSAMAANAPSGGTAAQAPLMQARVSGPRRQVSGLPGGRQSQPMAGALASLSSEGAPLPGAVARRATGSQQSATGREISVAESVTLRRSTKGTDLPTAAVPVENVAESGTGGVTVARGGLPSSLEIGSSATVRRAAADLAVGRTTAAAGTADSVLGSARVVAMAGQPRVIGDDAPTAQKSVAVGSSGNVVATASAGRTNRDDVTLAAASAGAMTGPKRTMGALRSPGTRNAAPELAQVGPSTGGVNAAPDVSLQANLTGPQRHAAGLPGVLAQRMAVDSALEPGAASTTPGMATGRRRLPHGDEPGPSLAAEIGRGPLRKTDAAGMPRGVAEIIDEQPLAAASAPESGDAAEVADGMGVGRPTRREGGLPVQIAAMAGPGGLGYDPSPEVGLPSRRARPESEIIHTVSRRFIIERSGGRLAIDGRVREQPTEAFRQRDVGRRAQAAQASGGSEGTEKAVEMGLDFFARHQFPDGRWSLHELPPGVEYEDAALGQMQADTAATGLALLSFLGAGYTHLDDKHRDAVGRGIDWLVRNQKPGGDLFTGGTAFAHFYSHGIAAIALCEAYGMTRDPQLREPAQKAIDFILDAQHPTRGGWRYYLDDNGVSTETDTSVSGWQLMALKSAQMAGLEVPDEALKKIDKWLDVAQSTGAEGQYAYNPHAKNTPEQRAGRKPNLAMTAEAMLMRMYLGHQNDESSLIAGARHLKQNLPQVGSKTKPQRDCYYWYYATQAMFQMQGDYWKAWNDRLRPLAQRSQMQTGEQAGSWNPTRPVADRWGHAGGRHYVTALHVLILEVYYRHLPLFQELGGE